MNLHVSFAHFTGKKIEAQKGEVTCPRLNDRARTEAQAMWLRRLNLGGCLNLPGASGSLFEEGGL